MDTTDDDVRREPTIEELNAWRAYMGWSLWDVIAARSTEGESGLIPRQEYETISFLQMWALYPRMMREITEAIGIDGVIDLGRTPRREVGSKLNITRNWSPQNCCHLGRAIALELGLESPDERLDDIAVPVQFARRMMHGTWGSGPGFACGNDYQVALLEQDILDRFLADEQRCLGSSTPRPSCSASSFTTTAASGCRTPVPIRSRGEGSCSRAIISCTSRRTRGRVPPRDCRTA
jgi:hypothetical protein